MTTPKPPSSSAPKPKRPRRKRMTMEQKLTEAVEAENKRMRDIYQTSVTNWCRTLRDVYRR